MRTFYPYSIFLGGIVLLVALGFFLVRPERPAVEEPALRVGSQLPPPIAEIGRQKLSEILSKLPAESNSQKALIARTATAFSEMHDLRDYAFKDEIRARIMDELLADARSLPLAKQILCEQGFAQGAYGESQAVARVYAIALLEHDARSNGNAELQDAAQRLSQALAESGDLARGRAQDLDDLVYAYAKLEDPKHLSENLSMVAQHFILNEHTLKPIRDGFFFALKRHFGEERARTLVNDAIAL